MSKFISQTIANYIHFMAQEVHNFKLCFSSFSHQKEKFRVTAITLILGGKSDISVEGWWEAAIDVQQALKGIQLALYSL